MALIGQLSTIGMSFVFAIVLRLRGGVLARRRARHQAVAVVYRLLLRLAAGVLNVLRVLQLSKRGEPFHQFATVPGLGFVSSASRAELRSPA